MKNQDSKSNNVLFLVISLILGFGGIIILAFNYLVKGQADEKVLVAASATLPTAAPVSTQMQGVPLPGTSQVLNSYISVRNLPKFFKRLLAAGETALTIPLGSLEYKIDIVSGDCTIDGVVFTGPRVFVQEYETGISYNAIEITAVTGEVIVTYSKPA